MVNLYLRQDYLKEKLQKVIRAKCFKCQRLQHCYKPNDKLKIEELEIFDVYEIDSCKRFKRFNNVIKTLSILFVMLFMISSFNKAQALNINGLEFPKCSLPKNAVNDGFVVFKRDENYYLFNHLDCSLQSELYNLEIANNSNGYYLRFNILTNSNKTYLIDTLNNAYVDTDTLYFSTTAELASSIVMSTHNISSKVPGVYKNIDLYPQWIFTHNDKIEITNKSGTIMQEDFNFKLNKVAQGSVLVTDQNGKMIEQTDYMIGSGINLKVKVPSDGKPYYMYFSFPLLYQDTIINFNNFTSPHFSIKKFEPKYEIIGQAIYEINTIDDITAFPYIKPTVKCAFLFKQKQPDDSFKTVPIILEKDQKHVFNRYENDSKLIMQFLHPAGSSVLMESNFNIKLSNEEITPLPKEVIDNLVSEVYGSDMPLQPSTQDMIVVATPQQTVKINRLGLSQNIISEMVDTYVETANDTVGLVEWFGKEVIWKETGDEPIRKYLDRSITNTMNDKNKLIPIGQYDYVIYSVTSGSVRIRIPAKYKINQDYTIDFIKQYVTPPDLEEEYRQNNPITQDLGTISDIYSRDFNNWYDNFWDPSTGGYKDTGNNIQDMANMTGNVKSLLDIFTEPVKLLFTGIPELYALIILGFGLSLVTFVLGR